MISNTVHGINIAVRDLEHWTERYEQVFGVKSVPVGAEGFSFPGMRGASFDLHGFSLNLITSADPTTSVGRFLERKGDGIFLLSLRVEDVDAAGEQLRDLGIPTLMEEAMRTPTTSPVNFVHPKEMGGVQIELIEVAR